MYIIVHVYVNKLLVIECSSGYKITPDTQTMYTMFNGVYIKYPSSK